MKKVTGEKPVMWGSSMIGFGRYRYKYESGREGEWFMAGFSPRSTALAIYVHCKDAPGMASVFARLGNYSTGKSCLYVKNLERVDIGALTELISRSYAWVKERHPDS